MDDLITKYDAMEAVRNTPYFDIERALITPEQAMEAIGALDPLHEPSLLEELRPKVELKRVIKDGYLVWECKCGWWDRLSPNYCPECGAKVTNGGF